MVVQRDWPAGQVDGGDGAVGVPADATAVSATAVSGVAPLTAREVAGFLARLQTAGLPETQRSLVGVLSVLESLKAAAAGVQAAVMVALERAVVADEAAIGVPVEDRGRGVTRQVALATRQSPVRAAALLRAARVWTSQMPFLYQGLRAGRVSEFRALVVVAESATLPAAARGVVDRRLFADARTTVGWGTKKLADAVRGLVAELDPVPAGARRERERTASTGVGVTAAAHGMAWFQACLPAVQAVAMMTAIEAATAGVPRGGRGVAQAGELYRRVTGMPAGVVAVTVNLVVSDQTLLGAGHEPAVLLDGAGKGYGRVPAQVARTLVAHGLDAGAAWVRRIYADAPGDLTATSSRQRFFPAGLAGMLAIRDQGICRTPYCDAPIRHHDHTVPARNGGATDLRNGAGLCARCNQAKEAPGWQAVPDTDPATGRHRVTITDPTGETYESLAPPLPTPATPPEPERAPTSEGGSPLPADEVPDTMPDTWLERALAQGIASRADWHWFTPAA